ncbi:MAG TPA: hypothetical protein VMU67_15725 [Steroidobacteraceae bacterium]|nr:hypothetical protein [Steroidobacteraceae bacterium]
MRPEDLAGAISAVFIVGMVWLRTRMHYLQRNRSAGLRLERAGWIYFAAVLVALAIGWFAAPALGRAAWPGPGANAVVMRVLWFLATYYLFILVHRTLASLHIAVFRPRETL